MATNWTLAQAKKVITEGTDIAAITDIGRRFPLTALAIAKIGDNEGATTIINALPEHITARKIESVLKDGIVDSGANDDDDDDAEDAEHDEKPAKKNAKAKAKAETDDTADDEDPIALYKKCKKAGLKVAPKKSVKYYKDALKKAQEAENEADGDADDWDDVDDEEEKPAKKTGKAAAKKSKAKTEHEPEPEDDDDEDEWDI